MRKKYLLILLVLLLALAVAGCSASGAETETQTVTASTALTAQAVELSVETVSQVSTDDLTQMAAITLNGTTASAEGEGVTIDGSTVTITAGGVYTLTGMLTDGQIIVSAGKKETVELVFSGVSITSSRSAAIYVQQADLAVITLAEGTENTLSDAASYVYPDSATDEPSAALYAKSDLTIRGAGALTVYGNYQNGITSKDDLVIESGTVIVEAENHGLRGKDSVTVLGGNLTITAGDDGIQSDNETDTGKGTILIEGGTLNIVAAHDGMQAQTSLTVTGGSIGILAGGGYTTESYSTEESYKALKSAGVIQITGGEISVNSLDDAIHAAQSVTISGGVLSLMSRDDGIHADGTVNITGGTIDIQICYEGIEGEEVNIGGGTISMLAADDGINAADTSQSGQSDRMGTFGGWGGSSGDSSLLVNITGGVITINAYGDGIDSNGSITMSGGELYISGPLSSNNGAIDYDGSFQMSGGILVAAGATGMAQTPDSSSAQPSIMLYFSQTQSAGSAYLLTNDSGTVLLSYTPVKEFQCIVFSAPELTTGSTYHLYESADGTLDNATLLYDVTLSSTITSVGGGSYGNSTQNWQTQQNFQPQQNNQRRP